MREYYLKKVDNKLFSTYHSVYCKDDINFWYNWDCRLKDTSWSNNCYFVHCDNIKIGGIIIEGDEISNPFLIAPFNDRHLFWEIIFNEIINYSSNNKIIFKGILERDVDVLLNFGVEIVEQKCYMCRPTEKIPYKINNRFKLENILESDYDELSKVEIKSYRNSSLDSSNYCFTEEEIKKNIVEDIAEFKKTNTYEMSSIVREIATNNIVGGCIAGKYEDMPNEFGCIFELFLLPEYRSLGLGEAMILNAIGVDCSNTPVVKLHTYINNPAILLYRRLGFIDSPKFSDMILKRPNK